MKPALALLALAVVVLAAWSRAGNTRSVKGARLTAGDHGAPDDSEVVGMPVYVYLDPVERAAITNTLNLGPIDWDGILSGAVVPDHERMN